MNDLKPLGVPIELLGDKLIGALCSRNLEINSIMAPRLHNQVEPILKAMTQMIWADHKVRRTMWRSL